MYLALNYIGNVYFGVQPQIELTFNKDADYDDTSGCAIDYTPTAKLLLFIGATIKPLGMETVWHKEASVEVAYSVLTSLEGCITHSEITNLETYIADLSTSRRRLSASDTARESVCYVDYTSTNTRNRDRFYKWGSRTSEWWANKTTLSSVCNVDENALQVASGKLLLRVMANEGGESMTGECTKHLWNWKVMMEDGG